MYKILKLQVNNFRNLNSDVIQFSPGINCIVGENGNGKTNILEAINVLATKKSFRKNTSFPQYLSMDGEKPEIILSAVINKSEELPVSYSSKITSEAEYLSVNGAPTKKRLELQTVFINPFDSYGFHNQPKERREWFDYFLSQIDGSYKKVLNRYQLALRQKNTLLAKKPNQFKEQILALHPILAETTSFLTEKRLEFLEMLAPLMEEAFQNLFSEKHQLQIRLETKIQNDLSTEKIYKLYENELAHDILKGRTGLGPHKDDYVLLMDGLNSYDFCSLGQQKMSYLSLLFAYIELFRYKYMSYPIVLIDDVSGELDQYRWRRLVEYLEKREFQVLITTANEKFKEELERIQGANSIYVQKGSIVHSFH